MIKFANPRLKMKKADLKKMTIQEIFDELFRLNIRVRTDGEKLRVKAPQGALTDGMRRMLRDRRDDILAFLHESEPAGNRGKPSSIPRRPEAGHYPVSHAQQRLWVLSLISEGNVAYNMSFALVMEGAPDRAALEKSFDELVRRHEILRTTIVAVNGEPRQKIHPPDGYRLEFADVSKTDDPGLHGRRIVEKAKNAPFDMENGPLFKMTLIRISRDGTRHFLLVNMHHIISDEWSMEIFFRELKVLYKAFSQGEPSPLPNPGIQYADFAAWQRERFTDEILDDQLAYWKKRLKGAPALLELPTDRPRPAIQTFEGDFTDFTFSTGLSRDFLKICDDSNTTLFMALWAAFASLLFRYTGREDIVTGSPVANRNHPELESLIGFFVNILTLRADFSGNPSFRELLLQTKTACLDAYANQDVPFERIVEELRPERSLSRHPIVQVMFSLYNMPSDDFEISGVKLSMLKSDYRISKFDMTLFMAERDGEISGTLEYNTDLFNADTVERMVGHFKTLIKGIVKNPDKKVAELPILTDSERRRILIDLNDTKVQRPQKKCIHHLFEERAAKTPDALAVIFQEGHFTYGELDAVANGLAHKLQSLGVGPDAVVGVCMERSLSMIAAVLGILKAGGAYASIDPDYPAERIAFILKDSGMKILLTQNKIARRLSGQNIQMIIASKGRYAVEERFDAPEADVCPDNLAYAIYTSGTTGVPKGAMLTHKGLANLAFWHRRDFKVSESDVATQLAGTGFDASVWEVWPYLSAGASLCPIPASTVTSPELLRDFMVLRDITVAFVPTPLAESLLRLQWPENTAMRIMLTGGDKLSGHPGKSIPFEVINNYGPTENTVVATSGAVLKEGSGTSAPDIGRPICNTRVYPLTRELQPVPVRIPGEMCIGGEGLARGYLGRPALTAEKFIPNPLDGEPGSRLYKTGDLCRYLPDGRIEFLGRIDNQVKIRGFRIELGEIETTLMTHNGVEGAVTAVFGEKTSEMRIIAYIVCKKEVSLAESELRSHLNRKLPNHMIPSGFVFMDALPLTSNGKIDRTALPAPVRSGKGHIAPRDTFELEMTHLWEDVLTVNPVGVHDNFFELGGHSLSAVSLLVKVRKHFMKDVDLTTFFLNPTVELLANAVRDGIKSRTTAVALQTRGETPCFFCAPGGGGSIMYLHSLAKHAGCEHPFYGLQASGSDGVSEPLHSVEEIATGHLEDILAVQPQGPYMLGGHSFGAAVAFEIACQLRQAGGEVAVLAIFDTIGPSHLLRNAWRNTDKSYEEEFIFLDIAGLYEDFFRVGLDITRDQLRNLTFEERLARLRESLISANLLSSESDIAQLRGFVRVLLVREKIAYTPSFEPMPVPVTLFKAEKIKPEYVEFLKTRNLHRDPSWGWGNHSTLPVDVFTVPGDHVDMMSENNAKVLGELLKACMEKAVRLH